MKALVKVIDHLWVDPTRIDALASQGSHTIVMLASGEQVTVWGHEPDEVLDIIEDALAEVMPDGDSP